MDPVDPNADLTSAYVGERIRLLACPRFDQPRTGVIVKAMPKGVLVKHDNVKTSLTQVKGGTFGWAWDEVELLSGKERPRVWVRRDGSVEVDNATP